ncbi:hypothetical protein QWZ13_13665 [Reinekea marina]|nr:hypothetical protein [Reinekea marina]MDN3649962.1 hypothetical protein [Reinekea marina]
MLLSLINFSFLPNIPDKTPLPSVFNQLNNTKATCRHAASEESY